LILRKWRARAIRAVSASASPLLRRQILALLREHAGILVRLAIRYRRWSTLVLLTLLCGLALVIFFLKGPFSLATRRLLILRGESRLELFPGSQKPCVFSPICPSTLLLPGSEIFLVSETAKNAPRSVRTPRVGFFLRHRLAHRAAFQGLRQKRTQL